MKNIISCEFNIDTACVELKFTDGTLISIDCTAVENEVADNRFQRSELDYLVYNAPVAYADLMLNGDPETYLKTVTVCKPYENKTTHKRTKGESINYDTLAFAMSDYSLCSFSVAFSASLCVCHSANSRCPSSLSK